MLAYFLLLMNYKFFIAKSLKLIKVRIILITGWSGEMGLNWIGSVCFVNMLTWRHKTLYTLTLTLSLTKKRISNLGPETPFWIHLESVRKYGRKADIFYAYAQNKRLLIVYPSAILLLFRRKYKKVAPAWNISLLNREFNLIARKRLRLGLR